MTRYERNTRGFSLLELLVAMAVMLIIMGSLLTAASQLQQRYRGEQMITQMTQGVRSTMELLSQEVGLAGHHDMTTRYLVAPLGILKSPVAQTVILTDPLNANPTANLFIGQKLRVGVGADQEVIQISAIASPTITAIFRKDHPNAAPVAHVSGFPTGIIVDPNAALPITSNTLRFYGDINGDMVLDYVEYVYNPVAGTLTRSVTPVGAGAQNIPGVLLQNVQPNPGGVAAFQFLTSDRAGFRFVLGVTVTMTVRTNQVDPESGAFRTETMTVNLVPRNVLDAYDVAGYTSTTFVQNQPPGLPIPAI